MNHKHFLAAAVAAVAVALTGCSDSGTTGTGGGSGGGTGSSFCTSTSCASGELCHPTAKRCVKKCTGTSECPDEAKICGNPVGSDPDAGLNQTCGCTSSASCSTATAGNICSDYDKVCQPKCTKNSDCPNARTCETSTGQCLAPNSGSDGGTDAGTDAGMETCSWGSNTCTGGKVCTLATGLCAAAASCGTTDGGVGGCPYGQFCSGGLCAEVPKPTCNNFKPDAGGKAIAWNGSSTSGPVIYSLTALPGDNNSGPAGDGGMQPWCGLAPNKTYTLSLKAYNANSTFPADNMAAQLGGLKYVREDGNEIDAVAGGPIFRTGSGYTVSPNLKDLTLKISLCSPTDPASINAGFYFTGGNEACVNVPD